MLIEIRKSGNVVRDSAVAFCLCVCDSVSVCVDVFQGTANLITNIINKKNMLVVDELKI